ncbi:SLOG cluster 4 domain-containing protein [Nocardia pneumoniae]|uniref:SLOG cluster 4 domain-containing protein n=1 Tax=Nocardia pneumoniae TaxID=228601 RepID=UPI000685E6C2|nr:DNA-processing protein DprA [Nocardia pneumoniae]
MRQVAVCGPRECSAREAEWARAVGELLARAGVTVLCGGGSGVMAAVADGAAREGGLVIGVRGDTDRDAICPGLSAVLFTNMGEARNAILVESADAMIVVGGSWGTLSEVALARRRGGIPVVSLGGWEIRDANGQSVAATTLAVDPADAVRQALGGIGKDAERPEPKI